jgi:hypothetical protein
MEVIVGMLMVGGLVMVAVKYQARGQLQLAATRDAGRLRHLRSGQFPSSCSWCKNTALARKLIMFERSATGWSAADVHARLQGCGDDEVEVIASALSTDQPQWRRICSERCANELFASEHLTIKDAFATCEYCSTRAPLALLRCPNCGASH